MIDVFCQEAERTIVREFLELFKTTWEFFKSTNTYDVINSTQNEVPRGNARLMLLFSSVPMQAHLKNSIQLKLTACNCNINPDDMLLPIYGSPVALCCGRSPLVYTVPDSKIAAVEIIEFLQEIIRAGLDLFNEVAFLMVEGQPIEVASLPILDSHV